MRIDGKDILYQIFLFENDRLAIHVFFAIRGHGALVPSGIACRMVANYDDYHIRLARQGLRLCQIGAIRIEYLRPIGGFLDALRDAYAIRRRAAIPIKQNLIGPWTDHGDGIELLAIQWKRIVVVFEQNYRLISCLTHEFTA